MTQTRKRSSTDKFAYCSFAALAATIVLKISVGPETEPSIPDTGALIESRIETQPSVPLAQVLATQVQIERLMAAGLINNQELDQAFELLEQSSYSVDDFVSSKGMTNSEHASLKMINPDLDAELYGQYKAMSKLVEEHQPGQ